MGVPAGAEIRIVDTAQVAVLFFGEKQSDVMLSTLGARPDPSMAIGYQFTSEGFGNPGGQSTPEIEELYIESLRETDPERRAEVLRANVAEVVEQAFQVPIAAASYNYGLADDMTGCFTFGRSISSFGSGCGCCGGGHAAISRLDLGVRRSTR